MVADRGHTFAEELDGSLLIIDFNVLRTNTQTHRLPQQMERCVAVGGSSKALAVNPRRLVLSDAPY